MSRVITVELDKCKPRRPTLRIRPDEFFPGDYLIELSLPGASVSQLVSGITVEAWRFGKMSALRYVVRSLYAEWERDELIAGWLRGGVR